MSEPGRYEIRAMGFAEILDVGFRLVREHFAVLAGCAAILYLPLAMGTAVLVPATGDPEELSPEELWRLAIAVG